MDTVLELVIRQGIDPHQAFIDGATALATELGLNFGDVVDTLLIQKAVPAHHSQFQARARGGEFRPTRRYTQGDRGIERLHPSETTPRDLRGRFMRRLSPEEQAAAATNANRYVGELAPRLQRHLGDYEAGHITSKEWQSRCTEDIKHWYDLCYREGKRAAGDPAVRLDSTDRAIMSRLVRDELDWLGGFADDLDAGRGRMPYAERMRMYAQAAREAFWNGWITGDLRPVRSVRWRFGQTEEHCVDCQRFVDMGWTVVREFYLKVLAKGFAPQSGQLACIGYRCQCFLEERVNGMTAAPKLDW